MSELPSLTLSFPNGEDNIASQCDAALQIVLDAHRAGVVDAPAISLTDFTPDTGAEIRLGQLNPVRFQVITRQLWLLGYLREKPRSNISPKHQEAPEFRDDLRRFQRNAGLKQDGWLGDKTWKTLQELVSFETSIDPTHWKLRNGSFRTAFNRALQLRMWAYGLAKKKPAYNFSGLRAATLQEAKRLIQALCMPEDEDFDWRSTLLDSDKILEGAIRAITHADSIEKDDKAPIRRLLISTARVELWLLDLKVTIDNSDNYPVENFGVKRIRVRRRKIKIWADASNNTLKKELCVFWQELLGRPSKQAKALSSNLSLDFFKALYNPEHFAAETDPFEEPDFSQKAAEALNTTEDIDKGYNRYRSLGMKLWDGLKRIWRWMVKGVKKIAKFADNLIRGFFRIATKSYIIVRTALIALTSATRKYLKGRIGKTGKHVVLVSKDFDYQLIVSDNDKSPAAARAIHRFSASFLFASRLVGLIVKLLTSAAQGLVGWARFLYILVKNYRDLVPAYRALQAVT